MKLIKSTLLLIVVLLAGLNASAQKVKLKKGEVLVDGAPTFTYKKKNLASQVSIYKMDGTEILFINRNNNETPKYTEDDFVQITFISLNQKLESATLAGRTVKYLIALMLEENVLDTKGNFDEDKMVTFFTKYDENITNRTLR